MLCCTGMNHDTHPHHTFMYIWLVGAVVVLLASMAFYVWRHQTPVSVEESPVLQEQSGAATSTPVSTDTSGMFTLALNETGESHGWVVTPIELVTDSRCAVDVQCIQAGSVEVRVRVGSTTHVLALAEPLHITGGTITLVQVTPEMRSNVRIGLSGYRFSFLVVGE